MASPKPVNYTFWETCEKFPPILVRILARKPNGPPLHLLEIATIAELEPIEVMTISLHTSWKAIPLDKARRFMVACNVDFCDAAAMNRVRQYLRKKPNYKYLRESPQWEDLYKPMLANLAKWAGSKLNGEQK